MDKIWKIYVHQNLVNGKLYIGQTCVVNVKRRWHGGANYTECPYFYNAIQKYGWDGFKHFVLIDNIKTLEEANEIEKYLINKYKTNDREFGYNIQEGGANTMTEETKEKIRQQHLLAHQMKPEVQRVKKEFEKVKDNLENLKVSTLSNKGFPRPNYQYICIETQKIYKSALQAEKDTGIPACGIRAVCRGEQKSTHNTHWDYYDEGRTYNLKDYIDNSYKSTKSKKVYCEELNIIFNSGNEAAKYLGLKSATHIFECCNRIRVTCAGYHWRYCKEE